MRKSKILIITKLEIDYKHIDEDIQDGKLTGSIFLEIDREYQKIGINGEWITFEEIILRIQTYHSVILEIFAGLPNKQENGHFYRENDLIK